MFGSADLDFMRRMIDLAAPLAEQPVAFLRFAGLTAGDRAAGTSEQPHYDPPGGKAITAVVNVVTEAEQEKLGGRVLAGDVVFQIRYTLVPTDTTLTTTMAAVPPPGPNDRIVWNGAIYKPFRVTDLGLAGRLLWIVRCTRL